ncbi:hypothetical protein TNIN_110931 [Trichonephila inaurata madagascariensis]|uniref:Uncharacterized protein n=1 Tax=Trichonephila inaurata madagascariensis TaxID=2747483 RepID=A0A8X6YW42_9ARAC|nr:hypothetical protein TNIN_110931 [Trichonephila inaurata madagascariensis]
MNGVQMAVNCIVHYLVCVQRSYNRPPPQLIGDGNWDNLRHYNDVIGSYKEVATTVYHIQTLNISRLSFRISCFLKRRLLVMWETFWTS